MKTFKKIHFEISERKILLRIIDTFVVLLSLYFVDVFFKFNYFNFSATNFSWTIVLSIYLNLIGTIFEMYNLQVASNQFKIIQSIVLTSITLVICYLFTPFITPVLPENRVQIFFFFVSIILALLFWRLFYQSFLSSYRFEKNVILICDKENLELLIEDLEKIDPHYKIVAYVNSDVIDVNDKKIDYVKNLQVEELELFVQQNNISELVIASQKTDGFTVQLHNKLLFLLENGLTIREYIQVFEEMTQRIPIHQFDKDFYKYFPFSRNNQNKLYLFFIKILEIILSVIALVAGIALIPFILLGNIFGNQGSLFYSQIRVGQNGQQFKIFKFRTMVKNAEMGGAVFSTQNDRRINPFGKFLRKTRIDEIPQFINVLNGDMALIGPRPERPVFVSQLSAVMPFYDTRHVVKPGITGWAQVNYSYGETLEHSLIKLQYDLYYIKHRSFFLDLNIIIKTFSTILFYRGQ